MSVSVLLLDYVPSQEGSAHTLPTVRIVKTNYCSCDPSRALVCWGTTRHMQYIRSDFAYPIFPSAVETYFQVNPTYT